MLFIYCWLQVANEEKVEELAPQPQLWDIHTPIPCDCKIEILKFNMENSTEWHHQQVNHVSTYFLLSLASELLCTFFRIIVVICSEYFDLCSSLAALLGPVYRS